VNIISQEP